MVHRRVIATRAVFVDLDGTLLNRNHRISDYTARALATLRATHAGNVALIVATGRPFQYVIEQMQTVDLHVDFIISSNGARIHSGRDFSLVREHNIPPRIIENLFHVNVERENGNGANAAAVSGDVSKVETMCTNITRSNEWLTNFKIAGLGSAYPAKFQPSIFPDDIIASLNTTNPAVAAAAAGTNTAPPTAEEIAAARAKMADFFQDVHMLFFYGPHENLLSAEQKLLNDPALRAQVSFSFSLPHIIDVYPKGIDKSSAVLEVLGLLGLAPGQAAAFGDGMNDATMLRAVGRPFVMANAQDRLKAAVPQGEIILSNEEDGVASKLVELFGLKVPLAASE